MAQQAGHEGERRSTPWIVGSESGPSDNIRLTDIEVSPVVFVRDPLQIGVTVESTGNEGSHGHG